MVRVRNSSAAALHRIQMRRLRHEWETKAAHDRRANRDVQDEAIQELFGIGLAMQITKREVAPQQAARMGGHINQLQGLITGFRAAIADVRAEPVNVPQWRTALREMAIDIGADKPRPTTSRLSGPVEGWRTRSPAARVRRAHSSAARSAGEFPSPAGVSAVLRRETRLAEAFVTLTDKLVAGYDVVELVHYLVEISVELLDATAAGLVLADGTGGLNVLASTSANVELLESLQIRTGAGPCVECYATGEPQSVADVTRLEARWPEFAPLALQQGFRSVHAVPLRLRHQTIGALNLFRTETGALAEQDRLTAQALADVATIGVLQERAVRDGAGIVERLQYALRSRVVIEQAKGVLAQHGDLDMDQAFVLLRGYARRHDLPLTQVGQSVVDRDLRPAAVLAEIGQRRIER